MAILDSPLIKYAAAAVIVAAVWYYMTRRRDDDAAKAAVAQKIKSASYYPRIVRMAADYNLPRERVAAIVAVESAGNPDAKGSAGEIGLMQLLTPAIQDVYEQWGQSYELKLLTGINFYDPELNIALGTAYLAILKNRHGDIDTATKRYNGRGAVTENYLDNVKSFEPYFINP